MGADQTIERASDEEGSASTASKFVNVHGWEGRGGQKHR